VLQPIDFLLSETQEKEEEIAFDSYNLEDVEKTIVRKALIRHNGNVTHAAGELGLTRTSLYRRMKKYGL
jgi:transcriptional regulator of acetoin/glycerol metabolism